MFLACLAARRQPDRDAARGASDPKQRLAGGSTPNRHGPPRMAIAGDWWREPAAFVTSRMVGRSTVSTVHIKWVAPLALLRCSRPCSGLLAAAGSRFVIPRWR